MLDEVVRKPRYQVLIGASGGADSVALMLHASTVFPPSAVAVLSVDHRTRAAATAERGLVAAAADRFGFDFYQLALPVAAANHNQWRRHRIAVFERFLGEHRIPRLWLGHHADDSIETALIRLLQSPSPAGAAGIAASRPTAGSFMVERPLLAQSARQIRKTLMRHGLAWIEDPSNRGAAYTRTSIRRTLRAKASPRLHAQFSANSYWRSRWERLLHKAQAAAVRQSHPDWVQFSPAVIRKLPAEVAEAVVEHAAIAIAGGAMRVRNADFGRIHGAAGPIPLGGAILAVGSGGLALSRDPNHIQQQTALGAAGLYRWDRRYEIRLRAELPGGGWSIGRLGHLHASRCLTAWPKHAAAAAPALWRNGECVAPLAGEGFENRLPPAIAGRISCRRIGGFEAVRPFNLAP